jgi:SAM-dependent methyltransferase/DNA-directed RNA polymerase subunit RPC12/RpoP
LAGLQVIGVDVDPKELARNPLLASVCAESDKLPFASQSFDLIICNHSLEHILDVPATLGEIRRVLTPDGRLFVSVPDGASASDGLYRLLFCGGGHLQRFGFEGVVGLIETGTGLHLAGWRELATSFNFVERRNFIPAPYGRLPGPMPRRMRWLGRLPRWCFHGVRFSLNLGSRHADRWLSTTLSRYGWALAFVPKSQLTGLPEAERRCSNVCMSCGSTIESAREERVTGLIYRCPYCSTLNPFFLD